MKKKFKFSLKKETLIDLTNNQLKSVVGGDHTAYNTSCPTRCVDEAPVTLDCTGSDPYTHGADCPTQSCVPGTSYGAGCTGSNTTTIAGCNTSESNCLP